MNHTYSFYYSLSLGLPLSFLAVSPIGIPGLIILIAILASLCLKNEEQHLGWRAVFFINQLIYGDRLKEEEMDKKKTDEKNKREDKEEKDKEINSGQFTYQLYGTRVPRWYLVALFIAVVGIHFCTLVSFWSDFALRESSECSDNLDCFALNARTSRVIQQEPLGENCTDFAATGDYTIRCYEVALDFITAIGNAGSVIVVGALIMNVQSLVAAGAINLYIKSTNKAHSKILIFCTVLYFSLTLLGLFLIPLLLAAIDTTREAIINTDASIVQFTAYYSAFVYGCLSSGPALFLAQSEKLEAWCENKVKKYAASLIPTINHG